MNFQLTRIRKLLSVGIRQLFLSSNLLELVFVENEAISFKPIGQGVNIFLKNCDVSLDTIDFAVSVYCYVICVLNGYGLCVASLAYINVEHKRTENTPFRLSKNR